MDMPQYEKCSILKNIDSSYSASSQRIIMSKDRMQEIRCKKCNKLLGKAKEPYIVEIKCSRCGIVCLVSKSEYIDFKIEKPQREHR